MSAPNLDNEKARFDTAEGLGLFKRENVRAYENVVSLLQIASGMPIVFFAVVAEDRQLFKAKCGLTLDETPKKRAFSEWAVAQQNSMEVFWTEDASKDDRFSDDPLVLDAPGIHYYAGVPIRAPNQLLIGTLCVADTAQRKHETVITNALTHAKELLEDELLLKTQSIHDHLTGLFNRRFFDAGLEREWRRAYRQMLPLAVMLVDLDHFKLYNDTYGHQAGDEVLRKVSGTFVDNIRRAGDMVARYGGEEFVFVLPETDYEGAKKVGEKIINAVTELGIPHSRGEHGLVSISGGAAIAETKEDLTLGDISMLALADEALYQSKKTGRNRITVMRVSASQETRRKFELKRKGDE